MFEKPAVRYIIYAGSAIVFSEVLYYGYRYLRELMTFNPGLDEIAEVIWTNELTQTCAAQHPSLGPATSMNASPQRSGNGYITKLPSPVSSPVCHNVYCAAYNVGRLIQFINKTQYTIDLAMYTFTSYELSQAISKALRRGVVVRIISDKEMVYSSGSQIIVLTKLGVPVRCPSTTMLMHHKFCILDGQQRVSAIPSNKKKRYDSTAAKGLLMSGSLNWTMQGFGGNWENILITSNKTLVNKFEQEFERMWIAFENKLSSPI